MGIKIYRDQFQNRDHNSASPMARFVNLNQPFSQKQAYFSDFHNIGLCASIDEVLYFKETEVGLGVKSKCVHQTFLCQVSQRFYKILLQNNSTNHGETFFFNILFLNSLNVFIWFNTCLFEPSSKFLSVQPLKFKPSISYPADVHSSLFGQKPILKNFNET